MATSRRILRNVPAVVSVVMLDADGAARAVDGPVTVSATRADGVELFADRTAEPADELGQYNVELTVEDTAELDRLELVWTEEGAGRYTTTVDIVGGFYFSPDEARTAAPGLLDAGQFPASLILDIRSEVEDELERITGRAFVPRVKRVTLDMRQGARLPDIDIRRVVSVSVNGVQSPAAVGFYGELIPLLPEQVANAGESYGGRTGYGSAVVAYEYGLDAPPADLKRAALVRFVDRLGLAKSGAPSRNEYQIIDGQAFTVTQPGVRGSLTGIREVDAVYAAYSMSTDFRAVRIG